MRYPYLLADVFTETIFGGNPLAVFPDGAGLDDDRMQRIARELNLSETVFVLPARDAGHAFRLRIFTPAAELPFAGHPTVGTAFLLANAGLIRLDGEETTVVFEEGVGPVSVLIRSSEGRPTFTQLSAARMPEARELELSRADLAATLSLAEEDVATEPFGARAVSCGVPFAIVPLADRGALGRARLDMERWRRHLAESWSPQVYLVTTDTGGPGADLRARMFAPALGVPEDPATGAAATALAGLLAIERPEADGSFAWTIEQGVEMGRPSVIRGEADKAGGRVVAVRVGGASVLVGEGALFLE